MRTVTLINDGWEFSKNADGFRHISASERVDLPHTWNAKDGQDGGNDYFRGRCLYTRKIFLTEDGSALRHYLEVCGANSSSDVYVDGVHLAHHDGGYSAFRVDLTDALAYGSELAIAVDNSPNDSVYPQMADFTFYGGLYRDVSIISVPETHFDLEYYGGPGIEVTPTVSGENATLKIAVYTKELRPGDELAYTVRDAVGNTVATALGGGRVEIFIPNVHLWNGIRDPYLYTAEARIVRDGEVLDEVSTRFGCRTFSLDPERGFILNGEEYPLRGVSRHQDRLGIGNALLPEHHREDIALIAELGANTVRLAHYQHDRLFYDLCDEYGMVVWAEIPYISKHLPNGRENTLSQMRELVIQNYNHPSIAFWGLSNEITMNGDKDPGLIENHRELCELVRRLDKTRLTAIACVSMCPTDAEYLKIPDAVAYNHYFGWYGGDTSMNGEWFDKFHAEHPKIPIGVSEYGCEALNWHTSDPKQGDYTEEYQAYYHEELIKQLYKRRYLFATYVWNMFDFGADARCEGGENGQNHKGLVTFDRKYKKDAFYAYKAWLSDEPFVHLSCKRYVDRTEDVTDVTVYSNLPTVELFANGKLVASSRAEDHFFRFKVKNEGVTRLVARAGGLSDEGEIRKVEKMNEDYILKEKGAVLNWFDIDSPEGRFSLNDKVSDISEIKDGAAWLEKFFAVLKNKSAEGGDGGSFELSDEMAKMMGGFTVLRLTGLLGMMNVSFTKEELLALNAELNQIKKPD